MNQLKTSSRVITWGGYLGITFLVALPLSVLMVRSGLWQQGLTLYALSCLGALLLLASFVLLAVLPRYRNWRSDIFKRGLLLLPGCLLLVSLFLGRGDSPPIHDITTDTLDPPVFIKAAEMRGENANTLDVKPDSISQQIEYFPGISTLHNGDSPSDNFALALATAEALGWEIYHSDPHSGVIEAVDTTTVMAFKDDIVIRLRPDGDGTAIDLRSVSRVGVGDIGANAKRILAFQRQFQQ